MIAILWLETPELPPCPSFLPDILPDMADEFAEEQRQLGQIAQPIHWGASFQVSDVRHPE